MDPPATAALVTSDVRSPHERLWGLVFYRVFANLTMKTAIKPLKINFQILTRRSKCSWHPTFWSLDIANPPLSFRPRRVDDPIWSDRRRQHNRFGPLGIGAFPKRRIGPPYWIFLGPKNPSKCQNSCFCRVNRFYPKYKLLSYEKTFNFHILTSPEDRF